MTSGNLRGEGMNDGSDPEERSLMSMVNRIGRFFEARGSDDAEEEDERLQAAAPKAGNPFFGRSPQFRLATADPIRLSVRQSLQAFEDVRRTVDGLKDGAPQIVNFGNTPPAMAARLLDFLTGAAHALDAGVTRIGEHVYLISPERFAVEEEAAALPARATAV